MIVDVEFGVVDPDGAALVVGHLHHPMSQARHQVQAASDVVAQLVEPDPTGFVPERRALDHRQRSDVLRLVRCLDPQERSVRGCHPVVVHVLSQSVN